MTKKGMPYSRVEYMSGAPQVRIGRFKLGSGEYDFGLRLVSQEQSDLRQGALEAARVAVNSYLTKKLGENNYVLHIRVYPHLVTREHRVLGQAGADRISQGMARAFGKPTGRMARLSKGQVVMETFSNRENENILKDALVAGSYKLPMKCYVEVIEGGNRKG